MVNFKAPPIGTIQRAAPLNPITAIGKSIVGVFIGIALILLLAPVVLWFAESQNTAKVFSFSEEVASTSRASGYIRTTDVAKADAPITCYENKIDGNCLYYDYKLEELQYEVKDYCGKLQKDQQVIEEKGQKCHLDSNNEEKCEQCYLVNESNWNVAEHVMKFQSFTIGDFKVSSPTNAKVIGAEEYSKQIDATHRESMEYLKDNTQLLVAGSSDGATISHGGKKKYLLVSSMDYDGTYEALKAQDRFIAWLLRATAFILLVFGYKMIFGPISVMSNFVRKIPLLGKWIDNAADFIIMVVSLLLAIVHFILLWILIILLKNIVLIAIVVAVGLGLFYLYTRFKKPPQQLPTIVAIIIVVGMVLFSQTYQAQKDDMTGHVTFATLEKETKITGTIKATRVTCTDTDSGLNYTVNGTVRGIWKTTKKQQSWTDSCKNKTRIQEGFCTSDGYAFYTTQDCPDTMECEDGKCVSEIRNVAILNFNESDPCRYSNGNVKGECVIERFYEIYPDTFDILIGMNVGEYNGKYNDISGGVFSRRYVPTNIGYVDDCDVFNYSSCETTPERLRFTNTIGDSILITSEAANSSFAHEVGHNWGIGWRSGSSSYSACFNESWMEHLFTNNSHWTELFQAGEKTSIMAYQATFGIGGGKWVDNGNGTFTLIPGGALPLVGKFNYMDLYAMGLMSEEELANKEMYVVLNPVLIESGKGYAANKTYSGTRYNVTLDTLRDLLKVKETCEGTGTGYYYTGDGSRILDDYDGDTELAKSFRIGMVLIKFPEQTISNSEAYQICRAVNYEYSEYWSEATEGLSEIDMRLEEGSELPDCAALYLS